MTALDLCQEAFWQFTIIVFILGTCIGSFLNVVIWRLPRGEFLSKPPSHCPKCRQAIRPWENIPLLSWLALRGRCSSCKEPISIRYPAIECLTGVAFLCVWFRVMAQDVSPIAVFPLFFLVSALIAVTFTDIETRTIPNKITYAGIIFGLAFVLLFPVAHPALSTRGSVGFLFPPGIIPTGIIPTRFLPAADSAAGALTALAILWAIRVLTSVIFGRQNLQIKPNQALRLTADGVFSGDEKLLGWEEIVAGEITLKSILSPTAPDDFLSALSGDDSEVLLHYRNGVLKGRGWTEKVVHLPTVEAEGISVTITRDAFGWGDIKLIVMIAALSGAAALPFILILSAVPGIVIGTIMRRVSSTCRQQGIPFAPFLSLGCLIWIFFGDRILALL